MLPFVVTFMAIPAVTDDGDLFPHHPTIFVDFLPYPLAVTLIKPIRLCVVIATAAISPIFNRLIRIGYLACSLRRNFGDGGACNAPQGRTNNSSPPGIALIENCPGHPPDCGAGDSPPLLVRVGGNAATKDQGGC